MRVLLVDDDQVDRESIRRLIREWFPMAEIDQFSSASEAVSGGRGHYTVAISDYRMPGVEGPEVASAIGALFYCPVVFFTGMESADFGELQVFSKSEPDRLKSYLERLSGE